MSGMVSSSVALQPHPLIRFARLNSREATSSLGTSERVGMRKSCLRLPWPSTHHLGFAVETPKGQDGNRVRYVRFPLHPIVLCLYRPSKLVPGRTLTVFNPLTVLRRI